ncbi:hypothetical protein WMY93_014563 [Mugilogobius chulae]|uniref:Integrase catalytic domain-containing protein n=1 Tax=Mugilogobius chulae TaxID=88201 RepID=A0AAW0NVQ7_9GOBI
MADQAALMAKATALKRKHELEEQEEKHRLEVERIRKQKEQIEMDAEIAAAEARLNLLEHNREQYVKPSETVNSAFVSHQAGAFTGAGDQGSTLSIVPVKLKSKKGDKVLQTYAFLDSGSTATFITNALLNRLNLQGTKTNILLRTMGQEKLVKSQCVSGLEIAELAGNHFFELPEVYTQDAIPVCKTNIPRQQDIERWDHFKPIRIPELDADVELLIGTNAAKLMEPWEIINSKNNGPYAVKTLLGWVINGPLNSSDASQRSCPTIHVNRISIVKLEELLVSQYNQEFNERTLEEGPGMSIEDKKFMEIVEGSLCVQEEHYCMDLPFSKENICLPNNRCIVEQRIKSLKRKFERNYDYKTEYTTFITNLIDRGYAEVVPPDQLELKDEDHMDDYSRQVTDTISNNFYVDDCLKSVVTEEEAVKLVKELTELCLKGGFRLSKWTSNCRSVLSSIPEEKRSKPTRQLHLDQDSLPVEKALGLSWCAESDTFIFQLSMKPKPHTRRGVLSTVSSVYDPLGFLAPYTLLPKLLLQEMCRQRLSWDDPIPKSMSQCWTTWLQDLQKLEEFKVKRCIKSSTCKGTHVAQLHHFADGSNHGYGTVSYLRLQDESGNVHLAFMLGKARVAPLKQTTIPRLELTAAVLAVRVDRMLKQELSLQLEGSCFWTDSQTVLRYINNKSKRFHTFVANRVAAIREVTQPSQWRYIGSKLNPADEASRGLAADSFLACHRWINGPDFLKKPQQEWPVPFEPQPIPSDDPEVKKDVLVYAIDSNPEDATFKLLHYFSSWSKLKISVAWFLKLKDILLSLSTKRKELMATFSTSGSSIASHEVEEGMKRARAAVVKQLLTVSDLSRAESAIIRHSQHATFGEEICELESGASAVKNKSNIYRLDPVLQHGLLRVGGRLSRSTLLEEQKHPVILSKGQHVSELILRHLHQELGHAGRNHMLAALRQKYWITNANSACRKILSKCVICRRYRGHSAKQKMADLPEERICPDLPPFTNVGVDYFGPIEVKRGRAMVKRYGVIFTCMASRAVHLEVAYSLTTDSCINAIRRFICRRGSVRQMRSDNGTNFIGAERELREALAAIDHTKIHQTLVSKEIEWVFNPPAASHHGGVWERLIRMVRKVLYSVLKQQTLDDENLNTIFCEVEAILNGRPITGISEDAEDLDPLTPNHILMVKGMPILPPGTFQESDKYIRKRWRQVQYLSDLFWKRWTREYLPLLQKRQKWSRPQRNFIIGDLVVVMDHTAPRGSWILGRVINAYPDKNGLVRVVQLKTKTGQLERPISKIFLLQEAL